MRDLIPRPHRVTAYGGPRCGEPVPAQRSALLELPRSPAWRGYGARWNVNGELLSVRYNVRFR